MGNFLKAVQDEKGLPGPLRSKFTSKNWEAAYKKLGSDEQDKNLFEAGNLIFNKAGCIRLALRVTFASEIKAITKIRAFLSLANHNYCVLKRKIQAEFKQINSDRQKGMHGAPIVSEALSAVKLELLGGGQYTPSEINQMAIDGLQVPLQRILEGEPKLEGNPEYGRINWNDVAFDLNMGVLYSGVEGFWDDCLWNGYKVVNEGGNFIFVYDDAGWEIRNVCSRARHDSLGRELMSRGRKFRQKVISEIGMVNVKEVSKNGRRQIVRLEMVGEYSKEVDDLMALRAYAYEPYYEGLLEEPMDLLQGATINELLAAWAIARGASNALFEKIENFEVKNPSEPNSWLPNHAPILQVRALERAVSEACCIDLKKSGALIDFLIYRGRPKQELWAQPLVLAGNEVVVPLLGAVDSPNLRRLVDVWLGQLGVDLGLRGAAFESYIRDFICKEIAQSPLLNDTAKCLGRAVKFTPSGEREEEIDIVLLVGNRLIVGEAKCFLEPTEAKQNAMHRSKVLEGVQQVKRKVAAINRHKKEFRERLSQLGLEMPENFNALPVLVLNSAIHCGLPVDDVPVIDQYIISVFFKGQMSEVALDNIQGDIDVLRKRIIYQSAEEASNVIWKFLLMPPQMERLLDGLQKRWLPIHAVNNDDWAGVYALLECLPNFEIDM